VDFAICFWWVAQVYFWPEILDYRILLDGYLDNYINILFIIFLFCVGMYLPIGKLNDNFQGGITWSQIKVV